MTLTDLRARSMTKLDHLAANFVPIQAYKAPLTSSSLLKSRGIADLVKILIPSSKA